MSANNHHARLIIGAWDKEALLGELLSQLEMGAENNPDTIVLEGPFGIEEARKLGSQAAKKPFGGKRLVLLDASQMTRQAQNALLKTLEEPGEGNHFVLVAPYEDILLPTLRSRARLERAGADAGDGSEVEKFLKLALPKRLDFAKKFHDSEASLGLFLDALLNYMREKGMPAEKIERVFIVRRYADDASVDAHLILQHLALVI